MPAEPTLTEALLRIKKEIAGVGVVLAAMGGGNWFSYDQAQEAEQETAAVAQWYAPELGRCRMQVTEQKKLCLQLIQSEKDNSEHWRNQCGR